MSWEEIGISGVEWKTLEGKHIGSSNDMFSEMQSVLDNAIDNNQDIKVYIGCDSQNIGKHYTSFVTAICLHRISDSGTGKGGRVYFFRFLADKIKNRNVRLLEEARISIDVAEYFKKFFSDNGLRFEVHADVNPDIKYKSHEVCSSVKGWIKGMGYDCVVKPHAFVASIVADRHTRSAKYRKKSGKMNKRENNVL